MAYDTELADRLRPLLRRTRGTVEKPMFGGLGFLLNGHLWVGIWKQQLVARVGPEAYAACLAQPHVQEFDVAGRPMTGWVLVDPAGVVAETDLRKWVDLSRQFVRTLPPKQG